MGAWCFVCDAPVEAGRCPTCGRSPTVVDDHPPTPPDPPRRTLADMPPWVWLVLALVIAAVLYPLLRSGFRLG